jgi:hypothetical protein
MAQPQPARITCTECNGWYVTERDLRDHMRTAHRRFVSDDGGPHPSVTQQDGLRNQVGTSKEEWAKISGQLRARLQARFNSDELDAIDRFILLASQASVFDPLRR